MAEKADRVMIIGIDSPIASRLYQWARGGSLPNLRRLMERGVIAPNCLVPFPTITPPNWTTIATGAWPMTHGITDFDVHIPGDPLDKTHMGFKSADVQAETIWEAIAKIGKQSVIVNYPATWPCTVHDAIQVGGSGLGVSEWRINLSLADGPRANLSSDLLISTEPYPFGQEIDLRKAAGWQGIEHASEALEAEVKVSPRRSRYEMDPFTWHLLVDRSGLSGSAYDTLVVAEERHKNAVLAVLRPGEWSPNIVRTFRTKAGPQKAALRFKLLELSADGRSLRLYVPGICALNGWGHPSSIEDEIKSLDGLPTGRVGFEPLRLGWIDRDTLVETFGFHHQFLADASTYLLKNKPWDLFITHLHLTDWLYHACSREIDPEFAEDKGQVPLWVNMEQQIYQQVDKVIGAMLEAADSNTLVVVVSDHGAKPHGKMFSVNGLLEAAGLLAYKKAPQVDDGRPARRQVDWSRTRAFAQRTVHIYINLRGREPTGIVEPGAEYEDVRKQVINLLHDYADTETAIKPVVLALRREDAPVIGLGGARTGDVVYAVDPAFNDEHGSHLPTATRGVGDLHGLFVMCGPGVKSGAEIGRVVRLVDVVPTVCRLAAWPVPEQCEGGVIYQALVDASR
ncbi:MAG: alkaline phosphatase family protein [Chloroflexi bacterium]|nr:alkaline phosphatase family protein [Chloroflexota bacterium]MCL5107997.1 alkaline phosphatase family protein [Chloroflexota bacterium]